MTSTKGPGNADMPWIKSYPPGIDWHAPLPVRPVHEILDETARRYGKQEALDFLGRTWTWSELSVLVDKFAKGLQQQGLKKGDKVALLLPNSPYYIVGYYAILKSGGTVVNLNPLYSEAEIAHMVADSDTDFLVTADLRLMMDKVAGLARDSRLKKIIVCPFAGAMPMTKKILFSVVKHAEVARVAYGGKIMRYGALMNNDGRPAPVSFNPQDDIAVLQYTGGTTGDPKAAMLTHANVTANVEQARLWFGEAREGREITLGVIPFFHVFAMTAVMNLSVMSGFKIVATPRFDLKDTLKTIDREKPTFFPAVPAIYNAINNSSQTAKYNLHSLKYCCSGGAPLPVEVKRDFEKMSGCVVVEGYGLTESSPIACVNPVKGVNKAGSIGLPLPGTTVEIRDAETQKLLPQGERGELCIRGPQVMKGYWKNAAATAKVLQDGYLRTGDIATMDADGYFFIVDRLKDMIITNGYKVYPGNVEKAIYANPKVEECIVAGLPDASRGEIVKAWIKPKAGQTLSPDEIKDFIKDKMSPMEIPRQIEIRDQPLPKTMIGKLSRKDIVAEELKKPKSGSSAANGPAPG